ncbi:hypothetical protein GZH53_10710 [Flavihumibacter sp. R14]|nr:hypothetical protein [Flavihumibacter soli]
MEHQNTEANKALFSSWVTDPAKISSSDSELIESMISKFPYCQILQSFRAKAAQRQPERIYNPILAKASAYSPDRRVLFNLVNRLQNLQPAIVPASHQDETYYEVLEEDDYSAELVQHDPVAEPDLSETDVVTHDRGVIVTTEETAEPFITEDEEAEIMPEAAQESVTEEASENPIWNEEEKMILENIASADFFAFEERLDEIQGEQSRDATINAAEPENVETRSLIDPEEVAETGNQTETQGMARYDDDSMPYSFLWWLHKTRKEHADTYQPYVEFKLDTNRRIRTAPGEELNQQIIENIFHLQSPLEEMEANSPQTVHFELKRKEEEIIERFIREEPQIHPPSPDKLDMENKARKSAEDPNDLVSETLATIYTEQMLFHKAIDTYQKLSLKFPEKRAYFADQISELQKKIN